MKVIMRLRGRKKSKIYANKAKHYRDKNRTDTKETKQRVSETVGQRKAH